MKTICEFHNQNEDKSLFSLKPKDDSEKEIYENLNDSIVLLTKIYRDCPGDKNDKMKYFDFFLDIYKKDLFEEYENPKEVEKLKGKKFRFIDSIVDFFIHENMIECIEYLYKFGYQPKPELYIYSMVKYINDLKKSQNQPEMIPYSPIDNLEKLYKINVPFHSMLCEYSARMNKFDFLQFFHKNGCEWNDLTLYGACYNLNVEMVEYCFENNCPWNHQTLFLFNRYFTNEVQTNPKLLEAKEKVIQIIDLVKKYKPQSIEVVPNENNSNKE